jgi:hypothetical protein
VSNILNRDDYIKLFRANFISDGEVVQVLNSNGCPNMTVCPECFVDDFCHVEGCSIAYAVDDI